MGETTVEKRKAPRIKEPEAIQIEIADKIYNIFNMGPTGIGFLLQDTGDFYEGKITSLRLIADKETYDLQGEVVHFSQALHLPSGGIYLCGMKLIIENDKDRKKIEEYIQRESLP